MILKDVTKVTQRRARGERLDRDSGVVVWRNLTYEKPQVRKYNEGEM